jgi:hypothetical protein
MLQAEKDRLMLLYTREVASKGLQEVATGNHPWHSDALYSNGNGGTFGFRVEFPGTDDNGSPHHISIQVSGISMNKELMHDIWVTTAQEGVEYLRGLFN